MPGAALPDPPALIQHSFPPGAQHPAPPCPAPRPCAARLVLVAPDEWSRGMVRVKDLAKREEADVPVEELA